MGSRQGEDTFLIYCLLQKEYEKLLGRLAEDLYWDDGHTKPVRLNLGVCPNVDKKMEIERRFECAKSVIHSEPDGPENTLGFYEDGQTSE